MFTTGFSCLFLLVLFAFVISVLEAAFVDEATILRIENELKRVFNYL